MNKIVIFIVAGLTSLVIGIVIYYSVNYHTTPEGALKELRQKTTAEVLPLPDNTVALLVEKDGTVSIASMNVLRPFWLYKDFTVYPTELNLYKANYENEVPYTVGPGSIKYTVGLIKNEKIGYTAYGSSVQNDNVTNVFSVHDHLDNPALSNVKLWFITERASSSDVLKEGVIFLNEDGKVIDLKTEQKNFINTKP